MDRNGCVSIGRKYADKVTELSQLTGESEGDAIRAAIDGILLDAKIKGLTSVPKNAIGLNESRLPAADK